ncbi:MAG: xanthine dehydrogenase family protein molybdopterin-binding subunit [Gammaproteobacteria bacterium]|nr:xanthine dehydrogenase family protein molybdopterin-binding subunit [Gammaproteobacteria bacterium]
MELPWLEAWSVTSGITLMQSEKSEKRSLVMDIESWGIRSVTGRYLSRVDSFEKAMGSCKFTVDQIADGCLWVEFVRSPYAHCLLRRLDLVEALAQPGIHGAIIFHKTQLHFAGEEIAAIAGASREMVLKALDLVVIDLDPLTHIHPGTLKEGNKTEEEHHWEDKVLHNCNAVVERKFETQIQAHCSPEPHCAFATWDDDRLEIWSSTQSIIKVRNDLAKELKIPTESVRVRADYVGGGFGSKHGAGVVEITAAEMARWTQAPVKVILPRADEQASTGIRPSTIISLRMGADYQGRIRATEAHTVGTGGVGDLGKIELPQLYKVPRWRNIIKDCHSNICAARPFRALGRVQATFATESVVDDLSDQLGIDPIQFRLQNDTYQRETLAHQLRIGADLIGWDKRNNSSVAPSKGIVSGIGVACAKQGDSLQPEEYPRDSGKDSLFTEVGILEGGLIEVKCATQDIGQGVRTVIAAVVAEEFGIHPSKVRVIIGDSDLPGGRSSGSSKGTVASVPTAKHAARKAKTSLIKAFCKTWLIDPEMCSISEGRLHCPKIGAIDLAKVVRLIGREIREIGEWVEGWTGRGTIGAHFAEVEVDLEVGRVTPKKIVAIHDCGLVVSRKTAENQIIGGVVGGVGYALLEEQLYDPQTGILLTRNFETYKVCGVLDLPEITPVLLDMPERGVIGLGELPVVPTPAAIANAVFNATRIRLTQLPMTPERLINTIDKKGRRSGSRDNSH